MKIVKTSNCLKLNELFQLLFFLKMRLVLDKYLNTSHKSIFCNINELLSLFD